MAAGRAASSSSSSSAAAAAAATVAAAFSAPERWFYRTVMVSAALYCTYQLYHVSRGLEHSLKGVEKQWTFTDRKKDMTSYEWGILELYLVKMYPFLIGHVLLGQMVRWKFFEHRKSLFGVCGLIAVGWTLGPAAVIYLIVVCFINYLASLTGSVLIVWGVFLASLALIRQEAPTSWVLSLAKNGSEHLMSQIANTAELRTISFCIENCWRRQERHASLLQEAYQNGDHHSGFAQHQPRLLSKQNGGRASSSSVGNCVAASEVNSDHSLKRATVNHVRPKSKKVSSCNMKQTVTHNLEEYSFLDMLSYSFYVPTLVTGPVMTFNQFHEQLNGPVKPWTLQQVRIELFGFLRLAFWTLVSEVILHCLYFNVLAAHPEVLRDPAKVPLWALSGVAYYLGQFFMLSYTVTFGLGRCLARLDQLDPPPGPKCIARIHLYSQMWKYFDVGLYTLITRYVYIPLGGSRCGIGRQFLASLASFGFIFYWHGGTDYIAWWAAFNFLGTSIEITVSRMVVHPGIQQHLNSWLSPQSCRRLEGLLVVPHLIMSYFAIFTFFGGLAVGHIMAQRFLFDGWPWSTLTTVFFLYCCIQVSMEIRDRERSRERGDSSLKLKKC